MSFSELTQTVLSASAALEPHFSSADPFPLPSSAQQARSTLLTAIHSLQALLVPPSEAILHHTNLPIFDLACLRWLAYFDIFTAVPLDQSISFEDLARKRKVPLDTLIRITRYASTNGWFAEDGSSHARHNTLSRHVATSKVAQDQLKYQLEINFKASFHFVEATKVELASKSAPPDLSLSSHPLPTPAPQPPSQNPPTPFNIAFSTPHNSATWASLSPAWSPIYTNLMTSFLHNPLFSASHLLTSYPWSSLAPGSLVLDLGGNTGFLAIALARAFPPLQLLVQDLPLPVARGRETLPEDVRGRVRFEAQDFLEENQARDVQVVVLRFVLHDLPDGEARKVLRNLRDVVKAEGRVVVWDVVLDDLKGDGKGEAGWLEGRVKRNMDVLMMTMFGARERKEGEWRGLVEGAGWEVERVVRMEGCAASLLVLRIEDGVEGVDGRA
ncbi:O-methyltransferase-like protein 9 [Elsinoe australis]|uniref:O-methyltransferase-like protein 9 n=1 Tax=Elsinoe australis TaxID=40998 RepID=A0A4U7B9I4_9PEZI|nr:O-methyltransferase-like protein 9 [Elsinoe australis]